MPSDRARVTLGHGQKAPARARHGPGSRLRPPSGSPSRSADSGTLTALGLGAAPPALILGPIFGPACRPASRAARRSLAA